MFFGAADARLTMENQKQAWNILRLSKGFFLFVALWLVKQQNACSSEALERFPRYAREWDVSNEFQPSTMGRSDTELALEPEETGSQYGMRRVSKKHLIVLFVVCLILLKLVSVRRERSKQAREKLKQEEAAAEEEQLPGGGLFVLQEASQEALPPKTSAQKEAVEKQTPPSEVGGFPQVKPEVPQVQPKVPKVKPEMKQVQPKMPQVQPTATIAKGDETHGPAKKVTPPLPAQTIEQPQFPEPSAIGRPPAVPGTGHVAHPIYPGVVSEQREGIPGHGAVMISEQDAELQELRDECSAISKLLHVARQLVDELPRQDATRYADALTTNVNTAEKAERDYSAAKGRGDPNTNQIRTQTVNVMSQSLQGAKNSLLHLATLAKPHGEAVEAYCSERLHFTDTRDLRSHLSTSLEANSVKLALETLQSVENTVLSLQEENEQYVQFLNSAEFLHTSDLRGFTELYEAVAALNFNKNTMERLAALDRALSVDILEMHRHWLVSKLQADRIPLEVDANLVIGIHTLLSETRPSNGWQPASGISNEEIENVKVLFSQQSQDVEAVKSAQHVAGVTAAFECANSYNQKLQYMLPSLKERLHAVLQNQPLSKEEAVIASKTMEGIAETGIEQGEELFKFCQTVYADVGGNPEAVALGVGVGKTLLNILGSKTKPIIDDQVKAVTCPEGDMVCSVRKYFATPARQLEVLSRDFLVRSHVILESTKKAKKYKLDKEPFGSSALDRKTDLRIEMATKKRLVALLGLRFQYFSRLAAEIQEYEKILMHASSLSFRKSPDEWNYLQEQFNLAKASISNSASHEGIPNDVDKMLQLSLRMQKLVLGVRLQLFNEPVEYTPNDPYSADLH